MSSAYGYQAKPFKGGELRGQLFTINDVQRFMHAGNACLTLVSKITGTRFTYKIRRATTDDGEVRNFWFVNVLTGNDNENDFTYLGQINGVIIYTHGNKSKIGKEAPSAKAFDWFFHKLHPATAEVLFDQVEVWHEGRCGRCNRLLTVPQSIAQGFGPECINHISK